jgi:hypothetical protein
MRPPLPVAIHFSGFFEHALLHSEMFLMPVGFTLIRMQDELSVIPGHTVNLNTRGSLSKYFRAEVMNEAEAVYVAA